MWDPALGSVVVLVPLAVLLGGIVLVSLGADGLVRGGTRLARAFQVSPLFIGLTVASLGTSLPEFVVSFTAALEGETTVAVGNAVGSNVLNILAVLGPTAVLVPLAIDEPVVRAEIPAMLMSGLVFTLFALNGTLGRLEGLILLAAVVVYTVLRYRVSRERVAQLRPDDRPEVPTRRAVWVGIAMAVGGSLALAVGGNLVVDGAVDLARSTGVQARIVAVVLVAGGTTVPELATTLVAAFKDRVNLGVGNIVGSCIFNLLFVAGGAAIARPLDVVPAALRLEVPAMLLAMAALFPMAWTDRELSRSEGLVLVLGLIVYLGLIGAGIRSAAML